MRDSIGTREMSTRTLKERGAAPDAALVVSSVATIRTKADVTAALFFIHVKVSRPETLIALSESLNPG